MSATLVRACAVLHVSTKEPDEDSRTCVGHCPACHKAVYDDQDPVWTCPANLSPENPHHAEHDHPVTESMQKRHGIYSHCWEDFGRLCFDLMPLHGNCYGSNSLTW